MNIDINLNRHMGLPDSYKLDRSKAFELYTYFSKLIGKSGSMPVMCPLMLLYYVDENGDFTKSSKRMDLIVKAILNNMELGDQFVVLQYIEDEKERLTVK